MGRVHISSRKEQHVRISIADNVNFRVKTTGFENWDFVHNALPEMDFSEIDTSCLFLGKKISFPFIVASMTGGYKDAERINRSIAEVCAEKKIGMGIGSQRQALESSKFLKSFRIARDVAPNIPIFGNLGAAEIVKMKDASPILRLMELIGADGFAIHLNPLQEFLQPEGNPQFRGALKAIEALAKQIPIIVKEVGCGISKDAAKQLIDAGVKIIDVAGAGGTSWAGVEILRRSSANKKQKNRKEKLERNSLSESFWDWGIPTADAIRQVCSLKSQYPLLSVIASGGISNGLEIAKAIALGADYGSAARPLLRSLELGGKKQLSNQISDWEMELKGVMFLTGSKTIADLKKQKLLYRFQ